MKKENYIEVDSEDFTYSFIFEIEKSFKIRFEYNDFENVKTIEELNKIIENKIQLENTNDCTLQQAFYKIQNQIAENLSIPKSQISPKTKLSDLFNKKERSFRINDLSSKLRVNMSILKHKDWIEMLLFLTILTSIALVFMYLYSVLLLVTSIILIRNGNEFETETVGDLTRKMVTENYLKLRRNPNNFNKNEVRKIIIDLISSLDMINKSKIISNTIIKFH